MSHPAELIQRILTMVYKDYPPDQHHYTIEKAIPGTRMFPDIFVCDSNGKPRCAVEIGYTRPEKLTAYRGELKIPDVRWYDKVGNLHADVEERVVRVSIDMQPAGLFAVYRISDMVECNSDECGSEIQELEDLFSPEYHGPWRKGEQAKTLAEVGDEISEYRCMDVCALVVTDYTRVWFCCFCDKCGETWMPGEDDSMDVCAIAGDIRSLSPREFAMAWGGREAYDEWDHVSTFVQAYLGMELRYEDGAFLNPREAQSFSRSLRAIRAEART